MSKRSRTAGHINKPRMRWANASPSAIELLRVLLAASLLLPLTLFIFASWLNYRSTFQQATSDLLRISEVAREQAAKVFDGEAQVIDRVNELMRGMDAATVRAQEPILHEALVRIVSHLPVIQSVLVVDASGHPLVSASTFPLPTGVALLDRDFYRAIVTAHRNTYITGLQVGEVNKLPFFGLARPWVTMAGSVSGVIDVIVTPSFFQDFYQALAGEENTPGDGKILAMVRDDGEILVRYPPVAAATPFVPRGNPLLDAIRRSPVAGMYRGHLISDQRGPVRIFAYRKVQDYPVYVVAARSEASIVRIWRNTMASHLVFGLPATLALCAVAWTALVRTRREAQALARARHEIQRRETAEAALLRSQRLEAIGQMTGGVAHDFNNLLTVILGSADMLARRPDDPARVTRVAEQIALAARRGGEVTQQLLAFSRRQLVNPELLDLNQRLQDFKPLLDRAAREAVSVEFDLDPMLGTVRLDAGHFEAAILNLVGNARDAMPQGGRVVISSRNVLLTTGQGELGPGEYVRVAVTDTGVGMDPATMARAFEPFFTTKEIGQGTGLGLSQVYGFAKQAGGDARIISAPVEGTTVELLLPRMVREPAAGSMPGGAAVVSHRGGGQVVMVVEDEPGVREMAVESLQGLGYITKAFASPRAALDCLRTADPVDVLFSDVVMPGGINGFQLASEARRLRPGLKVLLTSGFTGTYREEDLSDLPLLTKPYDRDRLAVQMSAVLEK